MNTTGTTKTLSPESFLSFLNHFHNSEKFWVAYSGGMDSSVLLHLFYSNRSEIKQQIEVVHVNHGLQNEADEWAKFCEKQSQQYGLAFTNLQINESIPKGESVEAWAREKRYQLIGEIMSDNDVLFAAHHLNDQIETFFLQALRGAGPRGLASMPVVQKKSKTYLARPLLNNYHDDLKKYAETNKLVWLDDKSNVDSRYDRNYLRKQLMPVIEARWPAYRDTVNRLINNQKEYRLLLNEIAIDDLQLAMHENRKSLDLETVKTLSEVRQKNLIFAWLDKLNLKTPGSRNIEKIISDVINSATEKSPCVNWENVEVRRYKNYLYASKAIKEIDSFVEYLWKPETVLNIMDETIIAKSKQGKGISKSRVKDAEFIIRFRQGGEKIKPADSYHTKTVKQLFQERAVLPWLRDRIPLIYINNDLVAIPGFCTDKKYSADVDEPSWDIYWSGYNEVTQS